MQANLEAHRLRSELFDLVNKMKSLRLRTQNGNGDLDARIEASGQLDDAACKLAAVYEGLGDVFIDVTRDDKDQSFQITF